MKLHLHSLSRTSFLLFIILTLLAASTSSMATHIKGAYLGWERTGNVDKPNEIKFIVRLAYDRSAFLLLSGTGQDTLPIVGDEVEVNVFFTTLNFADPAIPLESPDGKIQFEGGTNNLKVIAVDADSDIVICEPKVPVIHDYVTGGEYHPFIEVKARDTEELAIRGGTWGKIPATINTTSPNRAPSIPILPPLVLMPKGISTFTIPAVDPDGDTLTFKIPSEAEAGLPHPTGDRDLDDNEVGGNVPGLTIDELTGVITWDTTNLQQIAFHYPVQVIVQDHVSGPLSPVKSSIAYEILMWPNDPLGTPPRLVSSIPAKSPIAIPQTDFALSNEPAEHVYRFAPSFFAIEAIDDDIGSRLRVVATNLPEGAVFYSQPTFSVESDSFELWDGVGGTVIQDEDEVIEDRLLRCARILDHKPLKQRTKNEDQRTKTIHGRI
jgi:hypothetical protein